jgi:hypothetical protein
MNRTRFKGVRDGKWQNLNHRSLNDKNQRRNIESNQPQNAKRVNTSGQFN